MASKSRRLISLSEFMDFPRIKLTAKNCYTSSRNDGERSLTWQCILSFHQRETMAKVQGGWLQFLQ
jgi:hypothetical protein